MERRYRPGDCKEVPLNLEDNSIDLTLPTEVENWAKNKQCECLIFNTQCRDCMYLRTAEERDEYYIQKPHLKPRPKPKEKELKTAWVVVDVKKEEEVVDLTSDD
jgi:hypothetical protein